MKPYFQKKFIIIFAVILLAAGLAGSLPTLYYDWFNGGSVPTHGLPVASAQIVKAPDSPLITGHPVSISVPSVGINIPVIDGIYNKKTRVWTLSTNKAQFASITPQPNNQTGNTFIYGHALDAVFGHLNLIKPGGEAVITTDNGYEFTYRFYTTYATKPTDLSVLTYQGPAMLTLQTCSGTWYQNRQMYLFSYEKYQKV